MRAGSWDVERCASSAVLLFDLCWLPIPLLPKLHLSRECLCCITNAYPILLDIRRAALIDPVIGTDAHKLYAIFILYIELVQTLRGRSRRGSPQRAEEVLSWRGSRFGNAPERRPCVVLDVVSVRRLSGRLSSPGSLVC